MPQLPEDELARRLNLRVGEATQVPYRVYVRAELAKCHENAKAYAAEYPGCTPIGGWLIEPILGGHYFVAHTIIQCADGSWIDPTPLPTGPYRFLAHLGDAQDFEEQKFNRSRLEYRYGSLSAEELASLSIQDDVVHDPWGDGDEGESI